MNKIDRVTKDRIINLLRGSDDMKELEENCILIGIDDVISWEFNRPPTILQTTILQNLFPSTKEYAILWDEQSGHYFLLGMWSWGGDWRAPYWRPVNEYSHETLECCLRDFLINYLSNTIFIENGKFVHDDFFISSLHIGIWVDHDQKIMLNISEYDNRERGIIQINRNSDNAVWEFKEILRRYPTKFLQNFSVGQDYKETLKRDYVINILNSIQNNLGKDEMEIISFKESKIIITRQKMKTGEYEGLSAEDIFTEIPFDLWNALTKERLPKIPLSKITIKNHKVPN